MNFASLELCKELYELSGWGLHDLEYVWRLHLPSGANEIQHTANWEVDAERFRNRPEAKRFNDENKFFPGYDAGYVLRKLPETLSYGEELLLFRGFDGGDKRWWMAAYGWVSDGTGEHLERADTPEDVLCKLAIELFKQGVLTRES